MEKAADKKNRAHPITIAYNLKQFIYLIIIPVVRGFISAIQGDMLGWITGAWMDILTVFVMVGLAILNWNYYFYEYDNNSIIFTRGWFRKTVTAVPWGQVTSFSIIKPIHLKPIDAVIVRIDTLAATVQKTYHYIYLNFDNAEELQKIYNRDLPQNKQLAKYSPKFFSIIMLALFSTNSLVGVVYIATFISQSGKLFGKNFTAIIVDTMEGFARSASTNIPPAAVFLAGALLVAWLISFIFTLLRYKGFKAERYENNRLFSGGMLTKRYYSIRNDKISYVDLSQNLFMYLLKLYSMEISAVGFGKDRKDLSKAIPMEKNIKFQNAAYILFPNLRIAPLTITSVKKHAMRHLWTPIWLILGILAAMATTVIIVPSWNDFIIFVSLMALIPCLIFLGVKIAEIITCGIGMRGENITFCYSRFFNIHTIIVPQSSVVKAKVRQSIFQRYYGTCDVILHTQFEHRRRHTCKNLDYKEALEMFYPKIEEEQNEEISNGN